MSEKRFASKKLLRQLFGDEASYKQGKKEMFEWLEKELYETNFNNFLDCGGNVNQEAVKEKIISAAKKQAGEAWKIAKEKQRIYFDEKEKSDLETKNKVKQQPGE